MSVTLCIDIRGVTVESEPMGPGWQARVAGEPRDWSRGATQDEAIGSLIRRLALERGGANERHARPSPPPASPAMGAAQQEALTALAMALGMGPGWLPELSAALARLGWRPPGGESDLLAQGFADCEMLIELGLRALAEREDAKAKARAPQGGERNFHEIRAACLRELSFAISQGQFRTDAYDGDAVAKAHARAALAPSAAKRGKAGGLKAAANMSAKQRTARATRAAKARHRRAKKGE